MFIILFSLISSKLFKLITTCFYFIKFISLSFFIFCSATNTTLKYLSYMLTNEFKKKKEFYWFFRNLKTNKKIYSSEFVYKTVGNAF